MKKIIAILLAAMLLMFAFSACNTNDHTLTPSMFAIESTDGAMLEADEQPSLGYQPEGDEKSTIVDENAAASIIDFYGSADPEWIEYVDENVKCIGSCLDILGSDYDSEIWMYYYAEIQERMENFEYWDGYELEEKFLDEQGYTTYGDFRGMKGYIENEDEHILGGCPVIYKTTDDGVGIMYINSYGDLCFEDPNSYYTSAWNGDAHTQGKSNFISEGMSEEEYAVADLEIGDGHNFTAVYRKINQTFELWVFGEVVRSYQLPMDAVFVGVSDTEGYLFKAGTDLYVVRDYTEDYYSSPNDEENFAFELIASDVRAVLDDDYFWDLTGYGEDEIDYSSQPFLLMTNGELKVYVHDDPNVPANDPSNLKDWRGDAIH